MEREREGKKGRWATGKKGKGGEKTPPE